MSIDFLFPKHRRHSNIERQTIIRRKFRQRKIHFVETSNSTILHRKQQRRGEEGRSLVEYLFADISESGKRDDTDNETNPDGVKMG